MGKADSHLSPGGLTDREVVEFERIYDDHVETVLRFATKRLGKSLGEEVTAEVFHAAVIAFQSGQARNVTPAWLMAVARNKVVDQWRKAERRKAKSHLLRGAVVEFPDRWSDASNRDAVRAALGELPPAQRALLILRHVDGMSVPELARASGKSVRATESSLARARKAFRKHYQRMEVRHG